MSAWRALVLLLACGLLVACSAIEPRAVGSAGSEELDREVLVMLKMPAPHFRPSEVYAGTYGNDAARAARRRIAGSVARDYGLEMRDDWPMPALGVDCFVMKARDAGAIDALVERLSADRRVESAQRMNRFSVLAHNDPLYPLQPGATRWRLDELHAITTGRGVRIAEIDTGVEVDHPDLAGQVELARNLVDERTDVAEFHGTAVAGIMVARADNDIGIAGVAPGSRLLALRACWQASVRDPGAMCSSITLAKALQAALDERADVINLSVGGPRDTLLARLLDVATSRGIPIVAAVDPADRTGGFPASHPGVLAIADDGVHDRSVDILRAPGRDIPTTVVGRSWAFASGNSFAAAHVSGLVALLREVAPGAGVAQVRHFLSAPAPVSALGELNRIDACAAIAKARQGCACACGATPGARAALY